MLTAAEMMTYTTMRIATSVGGVVRSTGTAFFFNVKLDEEKSFPLLITNKHVINGADEIEVFSHAADPADPSKPVGEVARCLVGLKNGGAIFHPSDDVDVCGIPFGAILNQAMAAGQQLFFQHLNEENIPADEEWQHFDAIERVLMVGCPNGLYDTVNNLPITRSGVTATSLVRDYENRPEFMVDIACFPGSSGSPIFILDQSGYHDKRTNTYRIGQARFFLVGILFSGPTVNSEGKIIFSSEPRLTVSSMMHLGFAAKSSVLRVISDLARERYRSQAA